MDGQSIQQVAVIGAGSMGHGIAERLAIGGYDVTLHDIDADNLEDGYETIAWSLEKLAENDRFAETATTVLDRIETDGALRTAVDDADLVVEAVPEQLALKTDVFEDVDRFAPERAILASNTSSLSISTMAAATDRPDRFVGLHFFNPPVKMDLVEVIYGDETADRTAETAYAFVEDAGMHPIYVHEDIRGFVVNSILESYLTEPAWMVSADEATIRQADASMVYEREYPMGPFELADMTGIDISYHVRTEADLAIPPVMEERVAAGEYGRKTGTGYYDYEGGDGADYDPDDADDFDWLRVESLMINEAAALIENEIATVDAVDTGMRLGAGFPEGICERADSIGLGVVVDKLDALQERYDEPRYEVKTLLRDLVAAGETGRGAGRGLYEYEGEGEGTARDLSN